MSLNKCTIRLYTRRFLCRSSGIDEWQPCLGMYNWSLLLGALSEKLGQVGRAKYIWILRALKTTYRKPYVPSRNGTHAVQKA